MRSKKHIRSLSEIEAAIQSKENLLSRYPAAEDIYNKGKKQASMNPENITKKKSAINKYGKWNEKDFNEDKSGSDLDVPGAELDDQQQSIGSEDEENNYFSLGGDDHNDLDEDNG